MRKLRESFANILNETNLFTKNLRKEVTELELREAFSKFGVITSIAIKQMTSNDAKFPSVETNFGFICFSKREEAKNALALAHREPLFQNLYKDKSIYLTYHYRKEQYNLYKEMKKRTMAKYFARQFQSPMFVPFPMQPQMFANQYFGAPSFNPHQQMMNTHPHPFHPAESNYNRPPPVLNFS